MNTVRKFLLFAERIWVKLFMWLLARSEDISTYRPLLPLFNLLSNIERSRTLVNVSWYLLLHRSHRCQWYMVWERSGIGNQWLAKKLMNNVAVDIVGYGDGIEADLDGEQC